MGLIERDYVMRAVKQLAEAIGRLLKLKAEKRYDEAAQTVAGACSDLLGVDLSTLLLVDSVSGASLLGSPERVRTFARLLEELADLHRLQGDEARARARARHAVEMYRQVLERRADDAESLAGLVRLQSIG
ncbi:MAG: hypothetical protein IPJ65_16010 [Archangiaceae bacterium]|nr:hypothetical protein [Archangiaceae bacterium]